MTEKSELMRKSIIQYYYTFGNLNPTFRYETSEKVKLGNWIFWNRKKYKEKKVISSEEKEYIKFLENHGMIWDLTTIEKLKRKYYNVNFEYLLILKQLVLENHGLIQPNRLKNQKRFQLWYLYVLRYGNAFMADEHKNIWVDIYHKHIQFKVKEQKVKRKIK